jgi:3-methyladenine DNA glycosylase AlkD
VPASRDGRADRALIVALRDAFRAAADPERAAGMQAYMKSTMPYWGVPSPEQRRLARAVFAAHPLPDAAAWRATLRALWRDATHREERYAAIDLAGLSRYRKFEDLDALPVYAEWITTGAWWDYVDGIASHRLGALLRLEPKTMARTMRAWSRDPHLWKRRAAILCQLRCRADTDLALLYDCIEPNLADRDFFMRKAIGWALRAYAWTDPDEVVRYVRAHRDALSPLSKREALKNVLKSGRIEAIP